MKTTPTTKILAIGTINPGFEQSQVFAEIFRALLGCQVTALAGKRPRTLTTAGIFENQNGAEHSLRRKNLGPLMSLMGLLGNSHPGRQSTNVVASIKLPLDGCR